MDQKLWITHSVSPQLTPARATSLFENTIGNQFLDFFLNTHRNAPKKKFRIEIWTFSFQICFQNQLLTLESANTQNTRICIFSVWPLPEVKNWFWKHIWNENIHISIQKIFLKRFGQYLKKVKNGFPIVFSKSDVALAGINCWDRLWVLQSFWSIFYRKITGYF